MSRPLLVIVGQTATGKSDLAIKLAQIFDGEIICADSRTIYKEMDIGTAKPSAEDQKQVKHHLLDVVRPDEKFTVADFQKLANRAIRDTQTRGKLPILVGGSGLYIDAVIYDYKFRDAADPEVRLKYQSMSLEELQKEIINRGLEMPENSKNPRHLIRALETNGQKPKRGNIRKGVLIIGIEAKKSVLEKRIISRINNMVKNGLVEEVKNLVTKYGWNHESMRAPAYKSMKPYLEKETNLDEAKSLFTRQDLALAKRQKTWFKRNKSIHWVDKQARAVELVTTLLNK